MIPKALPTAWSPPFNFGRPAHGHGQQVGLGGVLEGQGALGFLLAGGAWGQLERSQPVVPAELEEAQEMLPGTLQVLPSPAQIHLLQREASQQRRQQHELQVG